MSQDNAGLLATDTGEWLRDKSFQFPMVKAQTLSRLIGVLELKQKVPTLGVLCEMSREDILAFPGIGRLCLDALLMFLRSDGLNLRRGCSLGPAEPSYEGMMEDNRRLRLALAQVKQERDNAMGRIKAAYQALNGKPADHRRHRP